MCSVWGPYIFCSLMFRKTYRFPRIIHSSDCSGFVIRTLLISLASFKKSCTKPDEQIDRLIGLFLSASLAMLLATWGVSMPIAALE